MCMLDLQILWGVCVYVVLVCNVLQQNERDKRNRTICPIIRPGNYLPFGTRIDFADFSLVLSRLFDVCLCLLTFVTFVEK